MYSHVHCGVTRPIPGAHPFRASLRLFKIVPDDFVATVRLALPALAGVLKHVLRAAHGNGFMGRLRHRVSVQVTGG